MHSVDDGAYVSMASDSTLLSSGEVPPDMATAQYNFAYGFLAVATVVLFSSFCRTRIRRGWMLRWLLWPWRTQVCPPDLAKAAGGVLSPGYSPPGGPASLTRWGNGLFNSIGLPTVGLDDEDARGVVREFKEGANPVELRRKWDQGE